MKWFWLSFADPTLKEGEQFLGVIVMPVTEKAIEFIDVMDETDRIDMLRERGQGGDVPFYVAVQLSHFVGINPGGEVQGYEITKDIEKVSKDMRGRLLSFDELKAAGL